jgi:hypothetical protein
MFWFVCKMRVRILEWFLWCAAFLPGEVKTGMWLVNE